MLGEFNMLRSSAFLSTTLECTYISLYIVKSFRLVTPVNVSSRSGTDCSYSQSSMANRTARGFEATRHCPNYSKASVKPYSGFSDSQTLKCFGFTIDGKKQKKKPTTKTIDQQCDNKILISTNVINTALDTWYSERTYP